MEQQIATNQYQTIYDTHCATALITVGINIIAFERANPQKVGFIFAKNIKTQNAVEDYWSNKLTVDARSYAENLRMLKTRIYTEK